MFTNDVPEVVRFANAPFGVHFQVQVDDVIRAHLAAKYLLDAAYSLIL